ncbi:MAG TPA: AMP-binding protein [Bryobacteraceae bacterium]|nr:AMP-binding protein [Bryobacteraceae bacterium]
MPRFVYHTVGDALPSKLLEYLDRAARLDAEFIVFDDGYRGWSYSYGDVARMSYAIRARLRANGIRKGDTAMVWSESRAGWVAALWACLADGVIVAPVDPQSSLSLFQRIAAKAGAKITFLGERVPQIEGAWRLAELEQERGDQPSPVPVETDDVAEIVFTSGTTAEPKGVIITHRNLLANLEPVAGEIDKYRKYAGPFLPLRILNLLPLSHLFGQALALYLPPLIPASVVFLSGTGAHQIARQVKTRKISALIAVPKILEVLRDFVVHEFPEVNDPRRDRGKWFVRWWRFRRVHRLFGFKFWCFVSGGAPLSPEVERFWQKLGFVVVQGYGLTETAPIVTLSHPFHVRGGTVGQPLAGVEVKIADDGEILVRGENVTKGYFQSPEETAAAFADGWFHTGDIGEMDAEGHLLIRGRKKEMIVTPEGLKVFPEDVEKVLNAMPGVRESAVIGKDRVHAVLVLDPGADANQIVRDANQKLEDAQRVRSVSLWPGDELPRTQSTRKLRRAEIAEAIRKGSSAPSGKSENDLVALVQKYAPGRTITPDTTLDELGLSSLERVQLMLELEEKRSADVDEGAFSAAVKVADLARPAPARAEPIPFPTYSRTLFARAARRLALPFWLLPLTRIFAHIRVSGRENLASIHRPVIFASNHQSFFDGPVILAALPARFRYRIATAMSKEFFDKHFFPERYSRREYFTNSLNYYLATFFFNTFPLPQHHAGAGQTIRYMGELIEQGWSILIFPEGDRTWHGEILPFQPGVGMIASRLETPVVPVRIVGVDKVLHRTAWWPRMRRVEVKFGAPIALSGENFAELASRVEAAVRAL